MRCRPALAAAAALAAGSPGCGDNVGLLDQLRALPGVADVAEMKTAAAGYRYFVLHFTQPVDHADPHGPTFLQEVSLLHVDEQRPLIVHTTGYWDYTLDHPVELTQMLGANQITIEHRFFGASRPDPADWSKLTIEQMADDEHEIVSQLRGVYAVPALASGESKGGMTAMYYRRFFPDDVQGTVPYVAPIMFGNPDARFPAFIATLGPADCHAKVQAAAVEMLANRRAQLEALAQAQAARDNYSYTRIALPVAVESAIESLEWAFWQYHGVTTCVNVPATTASDAELFAFLDDISPVWESDDDYTAAFEAYYYQTDAQLGYPDDGTTYLKPYYKYTDPSYFAGALPAGVAMPAYDGGAAMHDIDQFVEASGDRLLLVYGQWDPWTGGAFALGHAVDALEFEQPMGTHYSKIRYLADADRAAALDRIAAWTHVTPVLPAPRLDEPRPPRPPLRGQRALIP